MHPRCLQLVMSLLLLAATASYAGDASVEVLDQATGMTAGVLREPIAFMETGIFDLLDTESKQATVIYLGPVEWDRSGELTYTLWVQFAPGVGGHRLDDINAPGTVTLKLDDGTVTLSAAERFSKADNPYRLNAPVGQTAYFAVDVALLKRMAASKNFALSVRATDLSMVNFVSTRKTHAVLSKFIQERELADN